MSDRPDVDVRAPLTAPDITGPVELVAPDPAWRATAKDWTARLRSALGPAARGVHHVGSTAVDGLEAKPVVDLAVTVADLADEDAWAPALAGLGLVLAAVEAPGTPDARAYLRPASGDEVHVHVVGAGSRPLTDLLLLRDYLRAHAEHRRAYAALKRSLAAEHGADREAYAAGKDDFVAGTLWLADEWAVATAWEPPAG